MQWDVWLPSSLAKHDCSDGTSLHLGNHTGQGDATHRDRSYLRGAQLHHAHEPKEAHLQDPSPSGPQAASRVGSLAQEEEEEEAGGKSLLGSG